MTSEEWKERFYKLLTMDKKMNMTPYDKAVELVRSFNNYVSSWTTITKPHEQPEAIYEAGMKKGRAKQCALICVDHIMNEADYQQLMWWEAVKNEISKL